MSYCCSYLRIYKEDRPTGSPTLLYAHRAGDNFSKKVNDKLIRSLSQSVCLSIRSPISRVTLQSSTITIQNVHGVFLSSFPKSTTLKNSTRKLSLSVVAGGGRAFGHGPMVRVRHGKMTQAYRRPIPVSIFVRPTRRRCYRVS